MILLRSGFSNWPYACTCQTLLENPNQRINERDVSHLRHTISFSLQLLYRLSIAYYLSHCFALTTLLRY